MIKRKILKTDPKDPYYLQKNQDKGAWLAPQKQCQEDSRATSLNE